MLFCIFVVQGKLGYVGDSEGYISQLLALVLIASAVEMAATAPFAFALEAPTTSRLVTRVDFRGWVWYL